MDSEMPFTLAEATAVLQISFAIEGDRLHPDVTDFSARTLSIASGAHPHVTEYLLDRLGVFKVMGYKRSMSELRTAIAEHLPPAQEAVQGAPGAGAGTGSLRR